MSRKKADRPQPVAGPPPKPSVRDVLVNSPKLPPAEWKAIKRDLYRKTPSYLHPTLNRLFFRSAGKPCCWEHIEAMAKDLQVCERTMRNYLGDLEALDVIHLYRVPTRFRLAFFFPLHPGYTDTLTLVKQSGKICRSRAVIFAAPEHPPLRTPSCEETTGEVLLPTPPTSSSSSVKIAAQKSDDDSHFVPGGKEPEAKVPVLPKAPPLPADDSAEVGRVLELVRHHPRLPKKLASQIRAERNLGARIRGDWVNLLAAVMMFSYKIQHREVSWPVKNPLNYLLTVFNEVCSEATPDELRQRFETAANSLAKAPPSDRPTVLSGPAVEETQYRAWVRTWANSGMKQGAPTDEIKRRILDNVEATGMAKGLAPDLIALRRRWATDELERHLAPYD